jgi:hypothetical protein
MTRVVDRCPSCGVEHDVRVHACEACDTPLRAWCRVHSREIGWLDGPVCPRCAQEAARRPPVPPARRPSAGAGRQPRRVAPTARPHAPPRAPYSVEHHDPLWGQPVLRKTLRIAASSAVGAGVIATTMSGAWTALIVFGCVGFVFGGMLGWLFALDAE